MFVIAARYYMREGTEDQALELLKSVVALSRAEPGCVTYCVNQSLDNPRLILMFERFIDEAAFLEHAASAYVQEVVVGKVFPMIEKRERELFGGIEP